MQHYLRIQQEARKQQAEQEHSQSTEQADLQAESQKRTQPLPRRSRTVAPSIHFVETAPSVLRELPWILLREHKVQPTYLYHADLLVHSLVYMLWPDSKLVTKFETNKPVANHDMLTYMQ